jgi:transcriptional regulator with XRE-family HTH domain
LTLCEKIRFLRERKNLKQKEFAEILKIAQQTLSHYEKGRLVPDIETCKKIAYYFNVSLDELLDTGKKRQYNTPHTADLAVNEPIAKYGEKQVDALKQPLSDPADIIAAHMPDADDYRKGLPPEAIEEIREHIEFIRYKYRKKQPDDTKKNLP